MWWEHCRRSIRLLLFLCSKFVVPRDFYTFMKITLTLGIEYYFWKSPNFFSPWPFIWSREVSYWFSSKSEHFCNISSLFLFFSNSAPENSSKLKMTISQLFMVQMDWNFAWLPTLANCFIASKKFENQKFSLPVFVRITASSSLKYFRWISIYWESNAFRRFCFYWPELWRGQ